LDIYCTINNGHCSTILQDLKVTDFDLPDYMNVIEHAIECGKAVLLQNVREKLDPSLTPVLNKAMIKQGNETKALMWNWLFPCSYYISIHVR
jgi:hypothetical protein